jgi:hypothetical protein
MIRFEVIWQTIEWHQVKVSEFQRVPLELFFINLALAW